jgi:hypothetical protein
MKINYRILLLGDMGSSGNLDNKDPNSVEIPENVEPVDKDPKLVENLSGNITT